MKYQCQVQLVLYLFTIIFQYGGTTVEQ